MRWGGCPGAAQVIAVRVPRGAGNALGGLPRGVTLRVEVSVGTLGPFEDDVRAFFLVKCEKAFVQPAAFLLPYAEGNGDTGLFQLADASTGDLVERIDDAHHHTGNAFPDDAVGTRGRFPEMGTRLQGNVQGAFPQTGLVPDRFDGIDLGMGLAGAVMIPLSDDFAPGDDHTAYHGVGIGRPQSFTGQGEGHVHVFFILVHHLFSFHLVFRQSPKAAHGKNDNAQGLRLEKTILSPQTDLTASGTRRP